MNEVCDIGSGAPNIDFVVSVLKSIYSPLRIFSKMRGVTGGSDSFWAMNADGDVAGLVSRTVTSGLITY